ncbi:MAG: hypothetical protein Ct9H300mP1_39310 [Planctomycetaceae bacterium]|nr:MAG: hypothetical protein Ct9H300mP1_39310 [Planctomycetaceae bacterium]
MDFHSEVIAALSRGGCNQGACHGSPQGKNGFRLSLRGYKPDLDRMTLTREIFGRRTSPQNPDASLILAKAANRVPHVGGRRFRGTEPAYGVLRQWIFEGTHVSETPEGVVKMEVCPVNRPCTPPAPGCNWLPGPFCRWDDFPGRDAPGGFLPPATSMRRRSAMTGW